MKVFRFANAAVVMVAFVAGIASVPQVSAHDGHQHRTSEDLDKSKPEAMKDESLFLIDSTWTDQSGKSKKLDTFRGNPSVLAMVYTSCQAACPIITADMQRIEKALPPAVRAHTHFVLVSFDPVRDTPERLKKFAEGHGLDLGHWTLLTGSAGGVRELAAVLGIKYRKDRSGDFSHSNVITVLDSEGMIRHQQVGLRQDPKSSIDFISGSIKAL